MLVKSTLQFPVLEPTISHLGLNTHQVVKEVTNGIVTANETEMANLTNNTTQPNSTTQNLSFVEKLKQFVTEKPLQAIAITIAVGIALGAFIGKKMFNGKKAW